MTTPAFKDVLQCIDGPHKGMLAQVMAVNNGRVDMFHRGSDGTPTFFKITTDDATANWRHIGVARIGPRPEALEPEHDNRHSTSLGERAASPVVAPAQSPTAPLKIEELLEPLPPDVKAVPMNAEPVEHAGLDGPEPMGLDWSADDLAEIQEPTFAEKIRYSAVVTNGAGDSAEVHYTLRHGVDPKRFTGVPILKARRVISDVKPWSVTEIKEE